MKFVHTTTNNVSTDRSPSPFSKRDRRRREREAAERRLHWSQQKPTPEEFQKELERRRWS